MRRPVGRRSAARRTCWYPGAEPDGPVGGGPANAGVRDDVGQAQLPSLSKTEVRVYDALAAGRRTVAELQADLGLQPPNLRKALRALVAHGLVRQHGGRGQVTWYERADSSQ